MMKKLLNNCMKKFVKYMERTIKNKLYALTFVVLGLISLPVLEDGTFLLFTILMGAALFFAKDDVFEME